jgi:hypothetical protein
VSGAAAIDSTDAEIDSDRACARYFEALGRVVDSRWMAQQYDRDRLPDIACAALAELPPPRFTPLELLDYVRRAPVLPAQINIEYPFGEPPVCVFASHHFYIELLFWLNATTAIHQHAFRGAFHVLAGSSIHTRYDFRADDRVNDQIVLGDLAFRQAELLRVGQTRPIHAGSDLIHALFHLDRPSVTMVVRTVGGPRESVAQYNYFPPCLAKNPFSHDDRQDLLDKILDLLAKTDRRHYRQALADAVGEPEFGVFLTAFAHAQKHEPPERCQALLERGARRHGARARRVAPVYVEKRRLDFLSQLRTQVIDRDHRFFLALLLNVPRRALVVDLVRENHPGRNPEDVIMTWMRELSRAATASGQTHSPLGIGFSDAEATIFRHLFAGSSRTTIMAELQAQNYDLDGQDAVVDAFCRALTESTIFKPLFA